MSDETPRLHLPQLVSQQEMTNVTWNEALAQLDALVDLVLLGQYVNDPPAAPRDGDAYLIGATPTGAWQGYAYKIAVCLDGAWRFYAPFDGLRAFVAPVSTFIVYLNGTWTDWNSLIGAGEVSIASAAICDLGTAAALFVQVTGTTAIASFGAGANKLRFVRFAGALTLTHNATSLVLLGGASRTTAAGDIGIYASDASGNWRERSYFRAAANPGDYATRSGTETLSNKTFSGTTALPGGSSINAAGFVGIGTAALANFPLALSHNSALAYIDANCFSINTYWNGTNNVWGVTGKYGSSIGTNVDWGGLQIYATPGTGIAGNTSNPALVFNIDAFGNVTPGADNTQTMGSATKRWSVFFAGTGTINTSGSETKTACRPLSAAETAVAKELAANIRIFQFVEAVARKGQEAARLHAGQIYEDVVAIFAAHGLDPMKYGIVCRDPATNIVRKTRKSVRQKQRESICEAITVEDGKAVLHRMPAQIPEFMELPLVTPAGEAVIDDNGAPRRHRVPVLEEWDEPYDEVVPDLDADGTQKWIAGLRYDELAQFVLAGLAARLAALEAA